MGCRAARRRGGPAPPRLESEEDPLPLVPDGDLGFDAAPDGKIADHSHSTRLAGGHEIIEDLVGDIFVENALVAELDQVVLKRLQFYTACIWHVVDSNLTEIGETSFWTNRCELRTSDGDLVVAIRLGVGKRLEGRT